MNLAGGSILSLFDISGFFFNKMRLAKKRDNATKHPFKKNLIRGFNKKQTS